MQGKTAQAVARARLLGEEQLWASELRLREVQAELSRQRDVAAVEANDAAERMAALRAQLGRQQVDMDQAMVKAETVGDLLHASQTRSRVLQAQLDDHQQAASEDQQRAAEKIAE